MDECGWTGLLTASWVCEADSVISPIQQCIARRGRRRSTWAAMRIVCLDSLSPHIYQPATALDMSVDLVQLVPRCRSRISALLFCRNPNHALSAHACASSESRSHRLRTLEISSSADSMCTVPNLSAITSCASNPDALYKAPGFLHHQLI